MYVLIAMDSDSLGEYIRQLPAPSRILSIALRQSRVLGASAGHPARGPTTLDAAYARGLRLRTAFVLRVDPLYVMYVLRWC